MTAVKKTLGERLGKASGWLPAIAAFLCLGLFAMAAIALLDVNSEPKGGQSANITAVSAQGFSGLRRLLEARGHTITVNRMEDGPRLDTADIEIITLDDDGGTLTYAYNFEDEDTASGSSGAPTSSSDSVGPAPSSADSDTSASAASVAASLVDSQYGAVQIPDPRRSRHVLQSPLGRAVLIVAPKWQAGPDRLNPRWAMGQSLIGTSTISDALKILAPMTDRPAPDDKTASRAPSEDAFTRTVRSGDRLVTFDKADYAIKRDMQAVVTTGKAGKRATTHEGVSRAVTLTPAARQALFKTPLAVNRITALQSIEGPNLQPILTGPEGQPVLSRVIVTRGRPQPKVPVYLLSDPDLLNNLILADPQKVVTALTLVDAVTPTAAPAGAKSRIVFNLTFNGISFDHDLLHALARPPFIGVPLCLLIAGLGLMWAAFARFGPAREAPLNAPLGRGVQTLADNAARLMAITLKETRLGPAYADLIRDSVIRERGYVAGRHTGPLAEAPDDLAERIGQAHKTTDSFTDLKARSAKVLTVHQLIGITLKLHAWKTEIQRAHS
ncbi:hypothetical protein [Asticcacaulis sp. 201]|uniref:hypothetical protein n=1 Tax=Asticcacaulis sp. 201 TaxID=3028787 RepID=UPI0029161970|nr:hypothetical protein [Asticcacaulis sp. 201]MDV6330984.1 hypothetical protein [Asticcacaulis sp. 201]